MNPVQSISADEHGDQILAQLGQGGMAQILLAVRFGPGGFRKLYVIKRLRRDLANPAYANMFMHEARLAALLSHPNVVQSHEVNQKIDDCYLKMEYLDGQPLARLVRRVKRTQLPLEVHLFILTELLAGLHHAHELRDLRGNPLNVVHRDVSPGNVFLTYDGQVKLLDFGIAQSTEATEETSVGKVKGKVEYMSPEQARGEPVDRRADLYSVGVMLWEAIACGPFVAKGQAAAKIIERRRKGRYTSIQAFVPDVSPELAAICHKALSLDPDDRYHTAEEFRDVILEQLATMTIRPGREDISAVVQTQFREERALMDKMISDRISSGENAHDILVPETIPGIRDLTAANSAYPEPQPSASLKRSKAPILWIGVLLLGTTAALALLGPRFLEDFASQEQASSPTMPEKVAVPAKAAPVAAPTKIPPKSPPIETSTAAPKAPPIEAPKAALKAAPVETIKLQIETVPKQASIILNGKIIGSGAAQQQLDRDGQKHHIVIKHAGYETLEQTMVLDDDAHLELSLVPLKPEVQDTANPARPAAKASPKRSRTRTNHRRKAARPKATSPSPTKTPPKRTMGDDLRGKSRNSQRKIDKENPYSQ